MPDSDRTASLMTPSKLAQARPKAPASPAAWLDQMASDAGHDHVRRLLTLQAGLLADAGKRDCSSVGDGLARLGQALPLLDFGLLQPRSWWERVRGKSAGAGTDFAGQFEHIDEAARALAGQNEALRKTQQQLASSDRTLLELEVEFRALEKIIDQGSRWLQDMRNQLKAREAAGSGADRRQIEDDTARCEKLVARLKALRAVTSAAQEALLQAQGTAACRAGLMLVLKHALDSDVKEWRRRMSPLAAASADGSVPAFSLETPMATHRDLQLCIKQVIADCAQLQREEKALAEQLAALAVHLHAAS